MVVLQKNAVGQIITVIIAAAHTHGIFFKNPHVRRCFSRIQKLRLRSRKEPCHRTGIGCNAAHPLQVVQSYPLSGQQAADISPHLPHQLPAAHFLSILTEKFAFHPTVQKLEHPGKHLQSGNHAVLLADQIHLSRHGLLHNSIGGYVFTGNIFLQRFQNQMICLERHGDWIHDCFSFPYISL